MHGLPSLAHFVNCCMLRTMKMCDVLAGKTDGAAIMIGRCALLLQLLFCCRNANAFGEDAFLCGIVLTGGARCPAGDQMVALV